MVNTTKMFLNFNALTVLVDHICQLACKCCHYHNFMLSTAEFW